MKVQSKTQNTLTLCSGSDTCSKHPMSPCKVSYAARSAAVVFNSACAAQTENMTRLAAPAL